MKSPITASRFDAIAGKLERELVAELERQKQDCYIPAAPGDTDLLDTPEVDSKTVVQLSPIVEEQTGGIKIKPQWIRKGGYSSIQEAARHVIAEIRKNCFKLTPVAA